MRAWPLLLLLAACTTGVENHGLGLSHGNDHSERSSRKHLDVKLINNCAHAVEVCYGRVEHCVTLPDAKPQVIHADTLGGSDVFVKLKGTEKSVFANVTFDEIEVDESCARLERHTGPSQTLDQP